MKSRALLSSSIDHQVYKHNNLIESRYELNKIEQRLILLAIIVTRLNSKNGCLKENRIIEISVDDYMTIFDVDLSTAYHAMNDAIDSLYEKSFTPLAYMNNPEYDEAPLYHWLGHKGKKLSQGVVEFSFSEKALEYIIDLENNFTHYSIANVKSFNCEYSAPLYELVIKMRNTKEKTTRPYTIDEVRGLLGVKPETHRDKNNPELTNIISLRRAVIERAIVDINALSDIKVSYELFRTGRPITHIQFSFEFKTEDEIKLITIGDETSKPKRKTKAATDSKKTKSTTKPKKTKDDAGESASDETANDKFLGTDLSQGDLDNESKGSQFAVDYKTAVKAVEKTDRKAKFENDVIQAHQYQNYVNNGGTQPMSELERQRKITGEAAALFMFKLHTQLKAEKAKTAS